MQCEASADLGSQTGWVTLIDTALEYTEQSPGGIEAVKSSLSQLKYVIEQAHPKLDDTANQGAFSHMVPLPIFVELSGLQGDIGYIHSRFNDRHAAVSERA